MIRVLLGSAVLHYHSIILSRYSPILPTATRHDPAFLIDECGVMVMMNMLEVVRTISFRLVRFSPKPLNNGLVRRLGWRMSLLPSHMHNIQHISAIHQSCQSTGAQHTNGIPSFSLACYRASDHPDRLRDGLTSPVAMIASCLHHDSIMAPRKSSGRTRLLRQSLHMLPDPE